MEDIRSLLRVARRRLETSSFLDHLHRAAVWVTAAAIALIVADRLAGAPFVPWPAVVIGMISVAIVLAVGMWLRGRRTDEQVAVVVDERLDLREKLSTALAMTRREDPFARAAVEDAVTVARDPRTRERAKRAFPVLAPRGWWLSPMFVLAALLLSLAPQLDLFRGAETEESPEFVQARHEVAQTLDEVRQSIEENPLLRDELGDMLDELNVERASDDARKPRTPDEMRRDAIKRVTDLNDRLEQIISGERGKTLEMLEKQMRQLRTPADGPGREFLEALARADFSGAREAMDNLLAELEAGNLSEEEKQQLREQLEALAEELEKLAQMQKDLEDALRRAGMDPELANNPEALQQAIENNQNLNEQQRQQLQQMAQAQQAAAQMCQGLGGMCMSLAQAMEGGQMGQAGQQLSDQLSQMEQLQLMLADARRAQGMCQGSCQGLGQGLGLLQDMMGIGQGMGQGQGGGPRPVAPSPTRMGEQVQARSDTGEGDIIARILVDGPIVVGESQITPRQVVADVVEGFEEALNEDHLPRRYHDAQKHYFGELRRRVEENQSAGGESAAEGE